MQIATTDQF